MDPSALDHSLGFRLNRVARGLRSRWEQRLAPLGLTPPQAAILRAVGEGEGRGVRELGRRLGTDPMAVKRCVDELEARGLVRSAEGALDRRARGLYLSERGADTVRTIHARQREEEAALARCLSAAQRQRLLAALDLLDRGLDLDDMTKERHE